MTTDWPKPENRASPGSQAGPHLLVAAEREAGTVCSACRQEIVLGDRTAICRECGATHHEPCWWSRGGCRSYECSPGNVAAAGRSSGPVLTISSDELAVAEPLPAPSRFPEGSLAESERPQRRWNKVAVWSFAIALLGIPLFGLITGLVAMIVGCIALVVHAAHRKGMALAVAAIVIGLADILGWAAGLYYFLGGTQSFIALQEFAAPDLDSLDGLPEHLGRAMRANVLVESSAGLVSSGIGSGVILRIKDGIALIVTNRHVIDHNYSDWTDTAPENLADLSTIRIQSVGQSDVPARVEWVAPHGVDLAIVSAPLDSDEVEEALWDKEATPRIGEDVFAVGNPHGLGWTHSAGKLSQVRRRTQGLYSFRILQSTAALNPGNSGGGLYDAQGRLIGINTLTSDKRFGEGLGFSIALPTLLDLVPQTLQLPARNPRRPANEHSATEQNENPGPSSILKEHGEEAGVLNSSNPEAPRK